MRKRQREPIEDIVTRYFQYPALSARMERDLTNISTQIRELEDLMREDTLMPTQGVAHPELAPRSTGASSDPTPAILQSYLTHMQQAQQELFTLRDAQLALRREMAALEREHTLLVDGMELLTPWARDFLEMRYRYPTHDYKQIAISCDPEIDESTVRFHISRALDGLRAYLAQFSSLLTPSLPCVTRYAESRFL
jgi:hypothetical protein